MSSLKREYLGKSPNYLCPQISLPLLSRHRRKLPINPTSLFFPSTPSPLLPLHSTAATTSHRYHAARDLRLGHAFPRLFQLTCSVANAGSIQIRQEACGNKTFLPSDGGFTTPRRQGVGGSGGSTSANAKREEMVRELFD